MATISQLLSAAPLLVAQITAEGIEPTTGNRGFLEILFAGGWVGCSIILLLFALSLTAAYLIFEQLMLLRRSELVPEHVATQVKEYLAAGQTAAAIQVCRENPSLLSFLLANGLAETEGGWPEVEKAVEESLAEQAARLFRKIEYLSVIGNLAPMVGLLGTVTGMIFAFQQVAATQGAAGAADLAEGIYQALVTTVGGLLVAIPSLGAFAILRNRVDGLVAEAAHAALQALAPLKRLPRQPPPRAVTPGVPSPGVPGSRR